MVRGVDIPHANRLEHVRVAIERVALPGMVPRVVRSERHAGYDRNAARILGFIGLDVDERWIVTPLGQELLLAAPASPTERAVLRRAILQSAVIEAIAPGLLDDDPPDVGRVANAMIFRAHLAPATAVRRAAALLGWRDQVLETLSLPLSTGSSLLAKDVPEPLVVVARPARNLRLLRVQIQNYGPLREVDVAIGSFQVIIGANATGKSTFLDALGFVADALNHGLEFAWRQRAVAFEELVWQRRSDRFSIAVEVAVPVQGEAENERPVERYQLSVGRMPDGSVGVLHETLFLLRRSEPGGPVVLEKLPKGARRTVTQGEGRAANFIAETTAWKTNFQLGSGKLALGFVQESVDRFPAALAVRDFLSRGWVILALSGDKLRAPCAPDLGTTLRRDGENLPLVLRAFRAKQPKRYKRWLEPVKEALPAIRDITIIERPEDKRTYLTAVYQGGLNVPSWRLSDGTLRILALILIGYLEDDAVYLIEEPENGIHPQAIEAVYEALSTSTTAQVLIATHSRVFLGIVPPRKLLCFSHDGEQSRVQPGDQHHRLQAWDHAVDLATLFAAGVLG